MVASIEGNASGPRALYNLPRCEDNPGVADWPGNRFQDRRVGERSGAKLVTYYCHYPDCSYEEPALLPPTCPEHEEVMKPTPPPPKRVDAEATGPNA